MRRCNSFDFSALIPRRLLLPLPSPALCPAPSCSNMATTNAWNSIPKPASVQFGTSPSLSDAAAASSGSAAAARSNSSSSSSRGSEPAAAVSHGSWGSARGRGGRGGGSFGGVGKPGQSHSSPIASDVYRISFGTIDQVQVDAADGEKRKVECSGIPDDSDAVRVRPADVGAGRAQQGGGGGDGGACGSPALLGERTPAPTAQDGSAAAQEPKVPQKPVSWGVKQSVLASKSSGNGGSSSDAAPKFVSSLGDDEEFPALGCASTTSGKIRGPKTPAPASARRKFEINYAKDPVEVAATEAKAFPELGSRGAAADSSTSLWRGRESEEQSFGRGAGRGRGAGAGAGGGGFGRGGGRDREFERDPINSLGRTLTMILRHQAPNLKINIRSDGYTVVDELLRLEVKTRSGRPLSSHSVTDVLEAVRQDNKQRFGTKNENGVLLIRANQGHTIQTVESVHLLKPITSADEVSVCVHGTYRAHLASIMEGGLKRMTRNHVHFATGLSPTDGVISGMRRSSEIIIYLDVSKALADGMKLYISENRVILTEGFGGVVPPKYFKEVLSYPSMKSVMNTS